MERADDLEIFLNHKKAAIPFPLSSPIEENPTNQPSARLFAEPGACIVFR